MAVAARTDEGVNPPPSPPAREGGVITLLARIHLTSSFNTRPAREGLWVGQPDQHGIMIRGQTLTVTPIGVGQHAVAVDGELRRHKDVVYAAVGLALLMPCVERAVLSEAQSCGCVAVAQQSRLCENAVYFIVLVYVEVARQHNRHSIA